jgi:hypothetical protein
MSANARDAALRRLQLLNRWAAVAAVILTVAFSVIVAHAFPGRAIAKTHQRRSPAAAHRRSHHRPQRFPDPFRSEGSHPRRKTTHTQTPSATHTQTPSAPAPAPTPPASVPAPAPAPAPAPQPAPVVSGGS